MESDNAAKRQELETEVERLQAQVDEWKGRCRANGYREALKQIVDHEIDESKSSGWHFSEVRRIAREALT